MIGPSPEPASDLLFVYGTLRRGFRLHHHVKRLGAQFVANGKVQAELFDLGEFPGARPSTRPGKTVEGELYRLRKVENALRILDQVEGFSPRTPDKGLFQRGTAEVTLPNGERRLAWIYWHRWRSPRSHVLRLF
jgi:gamma-glutamylcyclotransferase (GGCT)/AIG2-like uncharacterized protein YtfP